MGFLRELCARRLPDVHAQVHLGDHAAFFKEVNENPGKNWLVSLLKRTGSQVKLMRKNLGLSDVDEAAPPLLAYISSEMCRVLDEANTPEAFVSKLLLMMLRSLCARASDLKSVAWEDIRLDLSGGRVRFILADWMQKVSDRKPIPLLPGNNDPSFCIFTAMGDAALVGAFNVVSLSSTATQHFMFPSLLKGTTPDVVLTTLLRSLAARVEGADPGMSSHSMRHGIVSEAMAAGFTPTAVAWFSGHAPDMSPAGLLSYLVRTAKAAMPVAAFTAGWPEHGSVYKFTPEPPNLDALGSLPHNESLDLVADKLFDISILRTPWLAMSKLDYSRALGPGGTTAPQMTHLRCLIRTWLASQIMYYPRRLNRYGTRFLPVSKLTDTVAQVLSVNKASAANVITQWADAVHKQFITANQMCLVDASLSPRCRSTRTWRWAGRLPSRSSPQLWLRWQSSR